LSIGLFLLCLKQRLPTPLKQRAPTADQKQVDPIRAGQQGQGKVTAEELAAPAVYLLCE
jgi:hypothetical protein